MKPEIVNIYIMPSIYIKPERGYFKPLKHEIQVVGTHRVQKIF